MTEPEASWRVVVDELRDAVFNTTSLLREQEANADEEAENRWDNDRDFTSLSQSSSISSSPSLSSRCRGGRRRRHGGIGGGGYELRRCLRRIERALSSLERRSNLVPTSPTTADDGAAPTTMLVDNLVSVLADLIPPRPRRRRQNGGGGWGPLRPLHRSIVRSASRLLLRLIVDRDGEEGHQQPTPVLEDRHADALLDKVASLSFSSDGETEDDGDGRNDHEGVGENGDDDALLGWTAGPLNAHLLLRQQNNSDDNDSSPSTSPPPLGLHVSAFEASKLIHVLVDRSLRGITAHRWEPPSSSTRPCGSAVAQHMALGADAIGSGEGSSSRDDSFGSVVAGAYQRADGPSVKNDDEDADGRKGRTELRVLIGHALSHWAAAIESEVQRRGDEGTTASIEAWAMGLDDLGHHQPLKQHRRTLTQHETEDLLDVLSEYGSESIECALDVLDGAGTYFRDVSAAGNVHQEDGTTGVTATAVARDAVRYAALAVEAVELLSRLGVSCSGDLDDHCGGGVGSGGGGCADTVRAGNATALRPLFVSFASFVAGSSAGNFEVLAMLDEVGGGFGGDNEKMKWDNKGGDGRKGLRSAADAVLFRLASSLDPLLIRPDTKSDGGPAADDYGTRFDVKIPEKDLEPTAIAVSVAMLRAFDSYDDYNGYANADDGGSIDGPLWSLIELALRLGSSVASARRMNHNGVRNLPQPLQKRRRRSKENRCNGDESEDDTLAARQTDGKTASVVERMVSTLSTGGDATHLVQVCLASSVLADASGGNSDSGTGRISLLARALLRTDGAKIAAEEEGAATHNPGGAAIDTSQHATDELIDPLNPWHSLVARAVAETAPSHGYGRVGSGGGETATADYGATLSRYVGSVPLRYAITPGIPVHVTP